MLSVDCDMVTLAIPDYVKYNNNYMSIGRL